MASWTFLTTHAGVMLLVAQDPGVRLRDIAASLDITERSAFGIITDLVEAGCMVKEKNGRRNRYHIQAHGPLPEPDGGDAPSARSWPPDRHRLVHDLTRCQCAGLSGRWRGQRRGLALDRDGHG